MFAPICHVQFFKQAGVDMELEMGHRAWTALTFATDAGQLEVAKYLHSLEGELGAFP